VGLRRFMGRLGVSDVVGWERLMGVWVGLKTLVQEGGQASLGLESLILSPMSIARSITWEIE